MLQPSLLLLIQSGHLVSWQILQQRQQQVEQQRQQQILQQRQQPAQQQRQASPQEREKNRLAAVEDTKALGITVPQSEQSRADEVIE